MKHASTGIRLLEIWDGYKAPVPIDNAAGIHLRQDYEIEPLIPYQMLEKVFGFASARLLHLRGVDEAKAHREFQVHAATRGVDAGQKPVSVEYPDYGDPQGFAVGFLGYDEQLHPPSGAGWSVITSGEYRP